MIYFMAANYITVLVFEINILKASYELVYKHKGNMQSRAELKPELEAIKLDPFS